MSISEKLAQKGLAAGLVKAAELKSPSSIAILDSGRNMVAFIRMENALLASIEISKGKAFTAASMNMKTGDIMPLIQPGAPLYGMETSHRQSLIAFAGGVPIVQNGVVIGAVGVAGGMPSDDESIAQAAADAISG